LAAAGAGRPFDFTGTLLDWGFRLTGLGLDARVAFRVPDRRSGSLALASGLAAGLATDRPTGLAVLATLVTFERAAGLAERFAPAGGFGAGFAT
jgi:hypothetical protein